MNPRAISGVRCMTCNDGTDIVWAVEETPDFKLKLQANCHNMWRTEIVTKHEFSAARFDWFLHGASHMPEKIPEYDLHDETPRVKGATRKTVNAKVAHNARIGAEMEIGGQRGKVVGICTRDRCFVELAP